MCLKFSTFQSLKVAENRISAKTEMRVFFLCESLCIMNYFIDFKYIFLCWGNQKPFLMYNNDRKFLFSPVSIYVFSLVSAGEQSPIEQWELLFCRRACSLYWSQHRRTLVAKITCRWIFMNFTYFVLLRVINKTPNFQDRFPDYFKRNAMIELPPCDVIILQFLPL